MAEPFLAEIRMFSFNFAPSYWATCDGQVLPINQNQALFSLLGIIYGGNGTTTFALPDLRGRAPIHFSPGYGLGQFGGEAQHTLTLAETPQHVHTLQASTAQGTASAPDGLVLAQSANNAYRNQATNLVGLPAGAVTSVGGQPHNNLQPYQVVNFCIALQGIYPPRD